MMKKTIFTISICASIAGILCPQAAAFDDWMSGLESSGIERSSAPPPAAASASTGDPSAAAAQIDTAGQVADRSAVLDASDMYTEQARADIMRNSLIPATAMPVAAPQMIAASPASSGSMSPFSGNTAISGMTVSSNGARVTITRMNLPVEMPRLNTTSGGSD